jgi:hypothetical protein
LNSYQHLGRTGILIGLFRQSCTEYADTFH